MRFTEPGGHVTVTPAGGLDGVIATEPTKLLTLASEIEIDEELPELKSTGPVVVIVKSPTFTAEKAE